jgi:hypothetical protein
MNDDDIGFRTDWNMLENEYLDVARKLYSKWGDVLLAIHSCEAMKESQPVECIKKMDKAIKEARDLGELNKKYVEALEKMKEYLQSKE